MEKSLQALRKSTEWFIDQDPTDILLTPRAPESGTPGPGGGVIYARVQTRPSQRVKLIHQGGKGVSSGEGGSDMKYDYVVVMPFDGEVAVGDTFPINGNLFVVESMDPDNGYEIKFYARQHGKKPTDG